MRRPKLMPMGSDGFRPGHYCGLDPEKAVPGHLMEPSWPQDQIYREGWKLFVWIDWGLRASIIRFDIVFA